MKIFIELFTSQLLGTKCNLVVLQQPDILSRESLLEQCKKNKHKKQKKKCS